MGRFNFLKCVTARQLVVNALPKGYIMASDIRSDCVGSAFMNTSEVDDILLPLWAGETAKDFNSLTKRMTS